MSTTHEDNYVREMRISRQLREAPGALSDGDLDWMRKTAPLWYSKAKRERDEARREAEPRTKAQPVARPAITKEQIDAFTNVFNDFVFGNHDTDEAMTAAFNKCLADAFKLPRELFVFETLTTLKVMNDKNRQREQRLASLEAKVAALEVAPKGMLFSGAWQRAALYHRHEGTLHNGSCWVCTKDESRGDIPGTGDAWQLISKAGRDGRDLR